MANGESQPASPREGLSLDMSSEKDRGLVRSTIRNRPKRWRGLDDSLKDELLGGLREANRVARAHLTDPDKSLEAAKVVGQLVKTGAVMEAQHQADEHLEDKNERLDSGKATENFGVKYIKGVDDSGV